MILKAEDFAKHLMSQGASGGGTSKGAVTACAGSTMRTMGKGRIPHTLTMVTDSSADCDSSDPIAVTDEIRTCGM